ncbi:hypothetical protein EVAR_50070_1 [Eumeta japonica]|uniref:Uncharacterized protein n=1 Tax=Eumeta variegata TaxID=151549 RepID=A0A4C1XLH1_EUMVA|nr:hypothetical protein EVAR_50070_1 [Eumeta japonica]
MYLNLKVTDDKHFRLYNKTQRSKVSDLRGQHDSRVICLEKNLSNNSVVHMSGAADTGTLFNHSYAGIVESSAAVPAPTVRCPTGIVP